MVLRVNIKAFLFKFNYFNIKLILIGLLVILNKIGLYNIGYITNKGKCLQFNFYTFFWISKKYSKPSS